MFIDRDIITIIRVEVRAFFFVWMTILLPTRTDDDMLLVESMSKWEREEENRKFMAVICVWFMDFYSAYVLNNFKVNVYLSLLDLKEKKKKKMENYITRKFIWEVDPKPIDLTRVIYYHAIYCPYI